MCHSHRSSPLTSAQTFVFPEGVHLLHQAYTRRLDVHTSRSSRASLEFDQNLTAMRHTPYGRQTIASLNRARWGDNVYIPVHKGWVGAGCNNRRTQPHYWAKSNTYSNAPVSNRAHNTTNGILRFLMTCRAADFNDTGFVSSAVHQVDTWLPADFSAGTYQILTVTQHGYRHVITLKSAAFIREIAIKSLPLHYKPIANQSRTNQQCLP